MATSIWKAEHRSAESPGKAFSIHPLVPFLGLLTFHVSAGRATNVPTKMGAALVAKSYFGRVW